MKDGFGVYFELLNYEPLRWVLENIKISRPTMAAEIARELFKFIRNVLAVKCRGMGMHNLQLFPVCSGLRIIQSNC